VAQVAAVNRRGLLACQHLRPDQRVCDAVVA
jgi:hypothetical protein